MELRIPYYFVSHAVEEDGIWLHESCLLWREADVIDFCMDVGQDERRKISQLSMLLPTESGRWMIEEIEEIWTAPAEHDNATIFFTQGRRRLGHMVDTLPIHFDQTRQKIYARPRARTKGPAR